MRRSLRILEALTVAFAVVATSISVAAPAKATGTVFYQSWTVIRNLTADLTVVPEADVETSFTVQLTANETFLDTLATDDIVEMRMEVSGTQPVRHSATSDYSNGDSSLGFNNSHGEPILKVPANGLSKFVTDFTGVIMSSEGTEVTFLPSIYVNGVKATGTLAELFDTTTPMATLGSIRFNVYDSSYTVQEGDYQISANSTVCADLSSVTSGQALTMAGALLVDGAPAGGMAAKSYYADAQSIMTNVPSPKPTKWLAGKLSAVYTTPGSVGKTLSWDSNRAISAGGTAVTTNCFSRVGTTNSLGWYLYVTDLNTVWASGTQGSLDCEIIDSVTGNRVDQFITGWNGESTAPCMSRDFLAGRTYNITFRALGYQYDLPIAEWTETFTPSGNAYSDPPVLTGTGPDAATYESINNPTTTNPKGLGGTATGSDGKAGKFQISRQNPTTLRLVHWGPTGEYNLGTGKYIDFTDPMVEGNFTGETKALQPQIGWYGNRDKWAYKTTTQKEVTFVHGTLNSSTTAKSVLPLTELDAACTDAEGVTSTSGRSDQAISAQMISAPSDKPLLQVTCFGAYSVDRYTQTQRSYLMEIDLSTANATATVVSALDSLGEINPDEPLVYGENNYYGCATYQFAANPKENLSASDPILVVVAVEQDQADNGGCYELFTPMSSDFSRVETTVIYADGTSDRNQDALALTGAAAQKISSQSLAFDGLGNVHWLLNSALTSNAKAHTHTLYSVATSGVNVGAIASPKTLTVDTDPAFDDGGVQNSQLVLGNGAGNASAIYAARVQFPSAFASSVINLTTGNVTTGEAIADEAWQMSALYAMLQTGLEAETSGGINYYVPVSDTKYSVIHWLPGLDPDLGPTVTSPSSASVAVGATAVLTATSTSSSSTWAITGGANSSLFQINSTTGALSFKNPAVAGTYTVEITVTDTVTNKTTVQTITVTVEDLTAPTINADASPTVEDGDLSILTATANESVTWSLNGGDDEAAFEIDSTTGALTFKEVMPAGTYTVVIQATDDNGNTTDKTITVTVGNDTTDPVITVDDTTPTVNPGDTTVTTLEADEDVEWSVSGGTNSNLFEIDPNTGELSFKQPAEPGTYTVQVTATDGSGNTKTQTLTITVPAEPVAPEITNPSTLTLDEFTTGVLATLSSNQDVEWEIESTNGITVSIVDGELVFDGEISPDLVGATITVKATNPDTGLSTTKTITIGVRTLTLDLDGSVDASGNGSFNVSANFPATQLEDMDFVTVDIDAVTDIQLIDGVLTFKVDPNYTGPAVFTFCFSNGETCYTTRTATVQLGSVAAPTGVKVTIQDRKTTRISWGTVANATKYVVRVNGKLVCTTTKTSCNYKGILGPKHRVKVTVIGANGSTSSTVVSGKISKATHLARVSNFAIDSFALTAKIRAKLKEIAASLKAAGIKSITIVGHTDDLGSKATDRSLSLARARAVGFYLQKLVPGLKVKTSGVGRTKPARPNTSAANRSFNRRVELFVP